jgi:RimJ/RimL family protein N-acetyltransferase
MNKYKVLVNNKFSIGEYSLEPFREMDLLDIKKWRNGQLDVLRQKKALTDEDQKKYYSNYITPSFTEEAPRIILFSFLEKDSCIGYGGLTNIDWECKRIELSFLMNTERKNDDELYQKDFSAFITLVKKVVFEEMSFNRIFAETYDIRPLHISILEKNGFVMEGRMKQHIWINNGFVDSLIHGYLKEYYYA